MKTEAELSFLRNLTCEIVGEIWGKMNITLENSSQNTYAGISLSRPTIIKDEEIMLVSYEVLSESS